MQRFLEPRPSERCSFHTHGRLRADAVPLRKQLKDAAREERGKKIQRVSKQELELQQKLSRWELTVGIEIHAQLNTSSKLFSRG